MRRSFKAPAKILPSGVTGLLFVLTVISIACGQADLPASEEVGRRQILLTDGWLIKQLDGDKWDAVVLARESESPDNTWLSARMPAQVHDVLLAHGRIADPHVGKNAADCAWVGEKDWAYVCRFSTPENHRQSSVSTLRGARHPRGRPPEWSIPWPFREHVSRVLDQCKGLPGPARPTEHARDRILFAVAVHARREADARRSWRRPAQEPTQVPQRLRFLPWCDASRGQGGSLP